MGEADGRLADVQLPLTPEDCETYQLIAAGEELPPGRRTRCLFDLGLITEDPFRPDRYIALDPRAAAHQLMTAESATLARAADRLTQIPAIAGLAVHFDPYRMYGGPGSEFIATRET